MKWSFFCFFPMPLILFAKGLLVGFAASAPMGPMGVLCVERTISRGHASGFASGYGVAFADTLFAALAVYSLSWIMNFISLHSLLMKLLGGVAVAILGFSIAKRGVCRPFSPKGDGPCDGSRMEGTPWWWGGEMLRTLVLTLTNPFCIFIFLALFAFFQVEVDSSMPLHALLLLLGVHLGALLWWGGLSWLVSRFRGVLSVRHVVTFSRWSGYLIGALGAVTVLWTLWGWLVLRLI